MLTIEKLIGITNLIKNQIYETPASRSKALRVALFAPWIEFDVINELLNQELAKNQFPSPLESRIAPEYNRYVVLIDQLQKQITTQINSGTIKFFIEFLAKDLGQIELAIQIITQIISQYQGTLKSISDSNNPEDITLVNGSLYRRYQIELPTKKKNEPTSS